MQSGRPAEAVRAALWQEWRGGPTVHCFLCAHHCRIAPGERGLCGVRENREGVLYTLVYGCPISTAVDPIEKKPLFHFLPGTCTYSLATVGCNFTCAFCQNADISQMPRRSGRGSSGRPMSPEQVVAGALRGGLPEHLLHVHRAHDLLRVRARLRPAGDRGRPEERLRDQRIHDGRDARATSTGTSTPPTSTSSRSPTTSIARWWGPAEAGARLHPAAVARWGSGWR